MLKFEVRKKILFYLVNLIFISALLFTYLIYYHICFEDFQIIVFIC